MVKAINFFKWKFHVHGLEDSIFPQMIYLFNAMPMKIPAGLFVWIDKLVFTFTWNFKSSKKNQDNSEKQSLWAFTIIVSQDSWQMHGTCLKCSTGAGRVKESDALETHRNTSQTSLHRNGDTHVNRWSWVSWMSICKKSALTPTSHQTQKSILNESYS